MGNVLILIEIGKAIKQFYDTTKEIEKYSDAVERVKNRKEPFPPPKAVQKMLDHNEALEKMLERIARFGVPEPSEPKVSLGELVNARTSAQARQKLRQALLDRLEHVAAMKTRIGELDKLEREAYAKSRAAYELSKFWGDLIDAPLPDIGTLNKVTYLEFHQIFQKLSGSLASVSTDAKKARKRIEQDLAKYEFDTETMRTNFETFGVH